VPNQLSAMALSKESPTDPSDGAIPASCNRALNPKLVYWADSTGRRNTSSVARI